MSINVETKETLIYNIAVAIEQGVEPNSAQPPYLRRSLEIAKSLSIDTNLSLLEITAIVKGKIAPLVLD